MLQLPENWNKCVAGWIGDQLASAVESDPLKHEFSRQFIGATLELSWELRPNPTGRPRNLETLPDFRWRIHRLLYVYLPVVDDDSLNRYIERRLAPQSHILIAPDSHRELLRIALRQRLGDRAVMPNAFSSFISMRIAFASIDADWTHQQTLEELVIRYNRRVLDEGSDPALHIELSKCDPSES